MSASEGARVSRAARVLAGNLRVDAAAAEVLTAFRDARVESLLLKGASISRWLYEPADPRPYSDCDLLVPPRDVRRAREVLADRGFEPGLDEDAMPAWWRQHAVGWVRAQDAGVIDLHQGIPGIGADAERAWSVLSKGSASVLVAGFEARALGLPGRALHLALHAAQHGRDWEGVLADLERAVERVDPEIWRAAADLADTLDARPALAAGMRLVPGGRAIADALGLGEGDDVALRLQARSAPPEALGFEQIARAPGPARKLAIVARKVVPPRTFMRAWSPSAAEGRLGLLRAYARRPFWLLGRAPAAFAAWRRARRDGG